MQNKFLLLNLFFGLFISKVFDQIKFFVTLFILLFVQYESMGQECLDYPVIDGPECQNCVPAGWLRVNSPDIINPLGSMFPGWTDGLSGPSPSGNNVSFFGTTGSHYGEGMKTTINNLTPGQCYTFGIWWEETIYQNLYIVPGSLIITIQGEEFIFSGAPEWQLAQATFAAASTSVEIIVAVLIDGIRHSIAVDGQPDCSELAPAPCCTLLVTADESHEICPGTSVNLNALAQNPLGNIQVEWTSIPANGVNFLNDPNILNPIFTFPNGDFDGETFNFLLTVTDDLCTKTKEVEVTVLKSEMPTFDFNICELSDPSVFPTTSNNGYDGTWSGNFDFPSLAGTIETYTFSLASNEVNCIREANFDIEIIEAENVLFDLETSFCVNDNNVYFLPSTSQNLINGTWNTSAFNPAELGNGDYNFLFVPTSQFCALPFSHSISIRMKPLFDTIRCNNDEPIILDPESINGMFGFWNPPVINPADVTNNAFISVWSPLDPMSSCVAELPVTFAIQDQTTLSFDLPDTLYINSGIYHLPTTSLEGIIGQWNFPFIDTDSEQEGTINLTFTSPEFCVQDFQANIIIITQETPLVECDITITVPQDITICDPGNVELTGLIDGSFLSFEWSSTSGYSNTSNLSPIVPVASTTTFTLSATKVSNTNLIVNGDFSSGNSGFNTEYNFINNTPGDPFELGAEGTYSVLNNPNLVHTDFAPCVDNSGSGNMMVVNGSGGLDEIWCQTINVNPGSNYVFQAFATSVVSASPAILQFSVNGNLLGSAFNLSGTTCLWDEFFELWESGMNTTAEICITNQNSEIGGNDFALDDIFFGPVCEDEKSFTVTVDPFVLEQPIGGLVDCNNPDIPLTVIPIPSNNTYAYSWDALVGNIVFGSMDQSVIINQGGIYEVTVTNVVTGCTRKEIFNVNEDITPPVINITGNLNLDCINNTSLLSFTSNQGIINSFWNLPNGVMVQGPDIIASTSGIYTVRAAAANGCIGVDSVEMIEDNFQIVYQSSKSGSFTCKEDTILININLFSNIDSVTWWGPGIVSQSNIGDTVAVSRPGTYFFKIHEGENCFVLDSVIVDQLNPIFQYEKKLPDTISCLTNETWLSLQNIVEIDSIIWSNNSSIIGYGDSLLVDQPGNYYIRVTDPNGCIKTDSIAIIGDFDAPVFTVGIDSIDCVRQFGQFNVNYTEQGSFLWNGAGTTSNLKNPTFTIEASYRLIVTAENGCKDSLDVYLPSSVDLPTITADISPITCKNPIGKIMLKSKQGAIFKWTDEQGNIGINDTIISNVPHTYSITVTTQNGCETSTTIDLSLDTLAPIINILSPDKLTCDILSVKPTVTASNYTDFLWKKDNFIITDILLEPTFTSPGTYQLEMQNTNGCTTKRSYIVSQDISKPNFVASANDLSCLSPTTTLTLTGDPENSYTWVQNNQIVQSGLVLSQPQMITIIATNELGCDSTITLDIIGNFTKPIIDVSPVSINCYTPTVWIKNKIIDPSLAYIWNTDKGIFVSDSLMISDDGFYELVATNTFGCTEKQEIVINVDKTETLIGIIGEPVIKCNKNSTNLTASVDITNAQFLWTSLSQNMGTNDSLIITEAGIYSLEVTNIDNGCKSNKSIQITKQSAPEAIDFVLDQPKCFGEKGRFEINKIINGTDPYDIIINGRNILQNEPIDLNDGVYTILVKDINGCQKDSSFTVNFVNDFFVNAGPDGTIRQNESYQIQAFSDKNWTDIDQITWFPPNNLSCIDCPNPVANPDSDTEYTIEITDKEGCIKEDKVWVRAKIDKGFTSPNIIQSTSSSDNKYFTIYPLYESIKSIISLSVYDRWGNQVFNTQNIPSGQPLMGWDGTFAGQHVVPGVYVWSAQLLMIDDESIQINGDITVIR